MKRFLLLAVCLMAVAPVAFPQVGQIVIYADPGITTFNLIDNGHIVTAFVWHINFVSGGARASWFKVEPRKGALLTWLGESSPWPLVIGDSRTGVAVTYGGVCQAGPVEVLTILYQGGNSPTCSELAVVAPDFSTNVIITDCSYSDIPVYGFASTINSDGSCFAHPVVQTSWGRMKALYR